MYPIFMQYAFNQAPAFGYPIYPMASPYGFSGFPMSAPVMPAVYYSNQPAYQPVHQSFPSNGFSYQVPYTRPVASAAPVKATVFSNPGVQLVTPPASAIPTANEAASLLKQAESVLNPQDIDTDSVAVETNPDVDMNPSDPLFNLTDDEKDSVAVETNYDIDLNPNDPLFNLSDNESLTSDTNNSVEVLVGPKAINSLVGPNPSIRKEKAGPENPFNYYHYGVSLGSTIAEEDLLFSPEHGSVYVDDESTTDTVSAEASVCAPPSEYESEGSDILVDEHRYFYARSFGTNSLASSNFDQAPKSLVSVDIISDDDDVASVSSSGSDTVFSTSPQDLPNLPNVAPIWEAVRAQKSESDYEDRDNIKVHISNQESQPISAASYDSNASASVVRTVTHARAAALAKLNAHSTAAENHATATTVPKTKR